MLTEQLDLRFGVLGPLQMSAGATDVPLGTPKQRAVLAMLLINCRRVVGADSLIDAVWGGRSPDGLRATLHAYVSNLRRLIAGVGADPHAVLASAPPGYRLEIANVQSDFGRFAIEKHAGVSAAAAGRFEDASGHLVAGLAEWRGPVLEDLSDFSFVEPFARALAEDRVVAQTAHAEAEIACGRPYTVVGELETLTAEHPYREPLWVQLITAYYVSDRQSDALDAYHRLRTTLDEDLGIDPGPTVRDLFERILRQEPLDVQGTARATAEETIIVSEREATAYDSGTAALREADGQRYPLVGSATRIGRSSDNDIVLADGTVSRHHAVINDTGTSFVITDLGSANGVHVHGQRIRASAPLDDGDRIRIGDHDFVFEDKPADRQ